MIFNTGFLALYVFVNIVAFVLYGADKRRAIKGQWRIRESALIAFSFFGPFGAAAGMKLFIHKTRKAKFKLVYLFIALHLAAFGYGIASEFGLI